MRIELRLIKIGFSHILISPVIGLGVLLCRYILHLMPII